MNNKINLNNKNNTNIKNYNTAAVLILSCPDKKGIVASVSKALFDCGANIVESNQHSTKPPNRHFFMRIVFELDVNANTVNIDNDDDSNYNNGKNNNIGNNNNNKNNNTNDGKNSNSDKEGYGFSNEYCNEEVVSDKSKSLPAIKSKLDDIASEFHINYKIGDLSVKKNAAVFVSKEDHCLNELLWQKNAGDILLNISCIISNHTNLSYIANFYKIPFIYVPLDFDSGSLGTPNVLNTLNDHPYVYNSGNRCKADNKIITKQEEIILEKISNFDVDFVILAKYMRIFSAQFINLLGKKIINIHHSFLPSFPGAKPYEQAYEKGVKIIGATAHFVNEKLDDGPIIEQDVIRITHEDDPEDLKRKGKIIERLVLVKAVKLYIEDRVIEYGNKTIVFD